MFGGLDVNNVNAKWESINGTNAGVCELADLHQLATQCGLVHLGLVAIEQSGLSVNAQTVMTLWVELLFAHPDTNPLMAMAVMYPEASGDGLLHELLPASPFKDCIKFGGKDVLEQTLWIWKRLPADTPERVLKVLTCMQELTIAQHKDSKRFRGNNSKTIWKWSVLVAVLEVVNCMWSAAHNVQAATELSDEGDIIEKVGLSWVSGLVVGRSVWPSTLTASAQHTDTPQLQLVPMAVAEIYHIMYKECREGLYSKTGGGLVQEAAQTAATVAKVAVPPVSQLQAHISLVWLQELCFWVLDPQAIRSAHLADATSLQQELYEIEINLEDLCHHENLDKSVSDSRPLHK
eukprot:Platyproteum_vivax@DN15946_c0_g1_i1.p1